MDSGMINKIQKARRYADERERITFLRFEVAVRGDHGDHLVTFHGGAWSCDCGFFSSRGVCSHTMALERILTGMTVEQEPVKQ